MVLATRYPLYCFRRIESLHKIRMETIQELNQDNKEKIRAVNKKFQGRLLEEPLSWRIKKYTLIGEPMSPNRRHSLSKPMLCFVD